MENRPFGLTSIVARRTFTLTVALIALLIFVFTFAFSTGGDQDESSNPKLNEVRAELAKIKDGMMMEGRYSCCIDPSCDMCAMATGGCECGNNLAKGKPVCPECKGGWSAGFGMMPDVDQKDVKVLPDDQLKKMYQNRANLIKNSKKKK